MKKYMYLSMCLLVNMFTVELSAITNDNSSNGLTHGHKPKCEACPPKDNCCTRLQCRTLIACAPIPVTCVPGATQITISAPGTYCLQNDTDCNVVIKSSQVTFDLNGHTINGIIYIESDTELQDITIKNGVIMVLANMTGITISGVDDNNHAENILLEDLAIYGNCTNSVTGGTRGLFVQFATHVVISRVYINGAKTANFQIDNSENVIIESSNFLQSCGVGGLVGSLGKVSNLVVTDCNFYKNLSNGLVLTSVASGNLTNCNFEYNNNNGLYMDGDSMNVMLIQCKASSNDNGFRIGMGTIATLNHCQAIGNFSTGFFDEAGFGSSSSYVSCYARANATNYNPALAGPFNPFSATTAGISYWYNVFA